MAFTALETVALLATWHRCSLPQACGHRNDLKCVEWDVKLYYTHTHTEQFGVNLVDYKIWVMILCSSMSSSRRSTSGMGEDGCAPV